jgi:site-specific DNA recombinase
MNRAVINIRVSTSEQAEMGYSLQSQLEACRKYAVEHGFAVVEETTDDCSGAIPVAERSGGARVYELLRSGQVDVVIQYTIDRTARDDREYPIEFLIFLRDVQDAGAELHFVDTGKSDGGILDLFRAWQAAEERRKIRERTMRGRITAAKAGKLVRGGRPPYGYMYKNDELAINPEAAVVICRMFDLYLGCGDERLSIAKIAERFTEDGVPTPREGKGWHDNTIRRILDAEKLTGVFTYAGIRIERPDLAIIDRETWEAAQVRRERNKALAKRNRKYEYLLSCRIRCTCGHSMYGSTLTDRGGRRIYRCHGRITGRKHLTDCREPRINGIEADNKVWDYIEALLTDPDNLRIGLDEMAQQRAAELEPRKRRLATIEDALERVDRKIRRLARAFADAENDTTAEAFKAELKRAAREKNALATERDTLAAELEQVEVSPEVKASIMKLANEIQEQVRSAPFEQKRKLLEALDVQVQLVRTDDGRALRVTCGFDVEGKAVSIEGQSS